MLDDFLNRVFNEDVMTLLQRLPDKSIDCVLADPDYNVGLRYNNRTYTKKFDEYIVWLSGLSQQFHRVLRDNGNFFIINYPKNNAYLRVRCLDNLFEHIFEYVWVYNTNVGQHPRRFTTAHRSILHCTKSEANRFFKDNVAEPYKNPTDKRIKQNLANGSKGRMPYSWIYENLVKNVSLQKTIHACQIPEQLSQKLILAATQSEDTVLIPFGGSGSEIVVCLREHRNFVSAEIDPLYHKMIIDRLAHEGAIDREYRLLYKMKDSNTNGNSQKGLKADAPQPRLLEKAPRSYTATTKKDV